MTQTLAPYLRLQFRLGKSKTTVDMETRERCYSLCCEEYLCHLPTEARTRRVLGSHFEGGDVVAQLLTGFGKSLIRTFSFPLKIVVYMCVQFINIIFFAVFLNLYLI